MQLLRLRPAFSIFRLLRRERTDKVICTGAAPGHFVIRIGNLLGARTVRVDSSASTEEFLLTNRRAGALTAF